MKTEAVLTELGLIFIFSVARSSETKLTSGISSDSKSGEQLFLLELLPNVIWQPTPQPYPPYSFYQYSQPNFPGAQQHSFFTQCRCPPGPPGPAGSPGVPGPNGPPGVKGEMGDRGEDGLPGKEGLNGDDGYVGLKGDMGSKGDSGFEGTKGERGPQGIEGASGEKGQKGSPGTTGPSGSPGSPGPSGSSGPTGTPGQASLTKIFNKLLIEETTTPPNDTVFKPTLNLSNTDTVSVATDKPSKPLYPIYALLDFGYFDITKAEDMDESSETNESLEKPIPTIYVGDEENVSSEELFDELVDVKDQNGYHDFEVSSSVDDSVEVVELFEDYEDGI